MIGNKLITLTTVNKKIASNPYCASPPQSLSRDQTVGECELLLVKIFWQSKNTLWIRTLAFCRLHWIPGCSHCAAWAGNIVNTQPDMRGFPSGPPQARAPTCSRPAGQRQLAGCRDSAQACLAVCGPMGCRLAGCSGHGMLQARTLEWDAMASSRGSSQPRDPVCVSCSRRQGDTLNCLTCELRQVVGAPRDRLEHGGGQRWAASEQSAEKLPWLWGTSHVPGCDLDGSQHSALLVIIQEVLRLFCVVLLYLQFRFLKD